MMPSIFTEITLPVSSIVIPKFKASERSEPTTAEIQKMAASIDTQGLLQRIGIRRVGSRPYLMWGWRRWEAHRFLGRETIEARDYGHVSDEDAEALTCVENLIRTELSEAQRILAAKIWLEWYNRAMEDRRGKPSEVAPAAETNEGNGANEGDQAVGAAEVQHGADAAEPTPERIPHKAVQEYAKAESVAPSTAQKDLKISQLFSKEQLRQLHRQNVNKTDIKTISHIPDAEKRRQIVNLIAAGFEPRKAIAEIVNPDGGGKLKLANGMEVDVNADPSSKPTTVREWIDLWCSSFRNRLRSEDSREIFDRAAETYYKTQKYIQDIHAVLKTTRKKPKRRGMADDPMMRKLSGVTSIAHPSDWLICLGCDATGLADNGTPCIDCGGAGFTVKTEHR